MISIALCDDEIKYLDFYENKIKQIATKQNILVDIQRFKNGESLLFYLEDHPNKFDLIYLDVLTGGITGIDTALQIRKFNQLSKIVFLTSSDSFVYDSFETNASNYLLKNIHDDKFESVFLSLIKNIRSDLSNDTITFNKNKTNVTFKLSDITYIESFKRMIILHTFDQQKHEFYYKLSDLTEKLSHHDFVLCHRSYLVNLSYIHKISKQLIILKNQIEIPISRNFSKEVTRTYIDYLNK